MNIYHTQRAMIEHEISRINGTLNDGTLNDRQYSKLNRRRSELIDRAKRLGIKIKTV